MNGSQEQEAGPGNAGQKQIPLDTQAANAVFRASPRQLQQYLAAKYAPALPNEVEDTEEDLEETELDDYDEEGWPENDELHEGTLEQPMGPSPFDVEEPACDRSDLYIIAVDQDKEGVCSCTSLAHSWMAGDYPDEEFLLGTLGVFSRSKPRRGWRKTSSLFLRAPVWRIFWRESHRTILRTTQLSPRRGFWPVLTVTRGQTSIRPGLPQSPIFSRWILKGSSACLKSPFFQKTRKRLPR